MKSGERIFTVIAILFVGMASFGVGCNLVSLPGPAELERAFVGSSSNIIAVDPGKEPALTVHTDELFVGGDVCARCHPEPGTDADGDFETRHFHGSRPCADCHSSNFPTKEQVSEAVGGGIGLNFSHDEHLRLHRAECGTCHEMNVHQHGVIASMVTCRSCHKQMGGPTECSECHPHWDEIMPSFHRNVDILETHGKVARDTETDCTRCHVQRGYCRDCHANRMPHPEGYHQRHLQEVLGHPETCAPCHGATPCRSCHAKHGIVTSETD